MEDLWDESVLVDGHGAAAGEPDAALTPVLKISFGGRGGAGTVLKIPAKYKVQATTAAGDSEPERGALLPVRPTASAKAARRALKKARKDVQRKLVGSPRASPAYPWGARSPACPRLSPSYPQMSPAYYRVAGGSLTLSPAHQSSQAPGPLRKKRHKHKLKHKRRRRDERRSSDDGPPSASEVEMKERCLSQKLSISLRRVRASEYAADGGPPPPPAPQVPPFPEASPPEPAAGSAAFCALHDGRLLRLHDVVWGKIHGFPWWPGKVMCINDASPAYQEAYVSWYGSTTSSLMPCSQLLPFLDTYESRVNRKRRGPYREAIRQATLEAQRARPPPPPPQPLALAGSPREVDVAS
ncbi:PWWP domain-containing protein 2B-like [Pollicipes pollicipes]|uniref:PWWP domain-containing protein 2B-like n=1 Tax=Pollicipes pollicipes TaxID=41117 RepID=UPI0018854D23|nr:PWWP domain-containing protein 2B-like [Pollicipes pollicipes]